MFWKNNWKWLHCVLFRGGIILTELLYSTAFPYSFWALHSLETLMSDERGLAVFCCFADFVQEILHFQRKPWGIGPSVLLSQMGSLCKAFRPTSLPTAALLPLWPTSSEAAWVLDWIQLFPLNSTTALSRSSFYKEPARYFRDFFILSIRSMSVPESLAYLHEKYFFKFGKSFFSCLRPSL